MPSFTTEKRRLTSSNTCFYTLRDVPVPTVPNLSKLGKSLVSTDRHAPILPGLPDDVAKLCLALVPRAHFPAMSAVSRRWRGFMRSKELITIRKQARVAEEWLYMLVFDTDGVKSHWDVLDCSGNKCSELPEMPGGVKTGFGVVVVDGKLMVMAGCGVVDGDGVSVTSDVYQYDSCVNSWSKLASMNIPRHDFACAEVAGMVYAVGGYDEHGVSLSSAEVYDPNTDTWSLIEPLRRPRWGGFACGFGGKLYIMGGRSSFTIGNSKFIDIYDPEDGSWGEMKNGRVMVTAHAVLGNKLFCMDWKNQRKLAIYNPEDNSWKMVPVPITGSSSVGFRFGILNGKLLLFSLKDEPGYRTLLYDPEASSGCEWRTTEITPSGSCLCSVTIEA